MGRERHDRVHVPWVKQTALRVLGLNGPDTVEMGEALWNELTQEFWAAGIHVATAFQMRKPEPMPSFIYVGVTFKYNPDLGVDEIVASGDDAPADLTSSIDRV